MKKKRIKQKEDKKTDRKHGNRTRKAILGILSVLVRKRAGGAGISGYTSDPGQCTPV